MTRTAASFDRALEQLRKICLALPETKETLTWGKPHFRVGEKIFAGLGEENGRLTLGFKLTMEHAKSIVTDPRFHPAPYVGHKGWVSMDLAGLRNWSEVRSLVFESYRLIAPKRCLDKLLEEPRASRKTAGSTPRPRARRAGRTKRKRA